MQNKVLQPWAPNGLIFIIFTKFGSFHPKVDFGPKWLPKHQFYHWFLKQKAHRGSEGALLALFRHFPTLLIFWLILKLGSSSFQWTHLWLKTGFLGVPFGSQKYVKVPKLHPTIERANFDLGRWTNVSRTGSGTLLTTCMRSNR